MLHFRMRSMVGFCAGPLFLAWTMALVAGLVLAFLKLLPWISVSGISLGTTWPLFWPAATRALDIAFLLGIPVGFSLGVDRFFRSGSATALASLGVSPWRSLRGAALLATFWLAIGTALGVELNGRVAEPGIVAQRLVAASRLSCETSPHPAISPVPMLDASWLCLDGAPPRLAGPLPGTRRAAWFSAESVVVGRRLSEVKLGDLRLVARSGNDGPTLRAKIGAAEIRGLWGVPAAGTLAPNWRTFLVVGTGVFLGLLGVALALMRKTAQRPWVFLIPGTAAAAAWLCLWVVDVTVGASALAYLLVPGAGVVLALVTTKLADLSWFSGPFVLSR